MDRLLSEYFQGLAYAVFVLGTAVLAVIDARTILLPRRVLYPVTASGLALLVAASACGAGWLRLAMALGSSAVLLVIFGALYRRTSLGFGDVRLAGLLGLFLGWTGPGTVVDGVLVGMIGGSLVAGLLLAMKRVGRQDMLAYGPFLIGGAWLALLWQAA